MGEFLVNLARGDTHNWANPNYIWAQFFSNQRLVSATNHKSLKLYSFSDQQTMAINDFSDQSSVPNI